MKINVRLITGFLIVAMLIGTVGIVAVNLSQNTLKNEFNNRLEALAFSRANHVSDVIKTSLDIITGSVELDVLQNNLYNIVNGIDVETSQAKLLETIQDLNDKTNSFYRIKVIDKNGIIVAYSTDSGIGENETGKDFSSRDYFSKGLNGLFIGNPRHSDTTDTSELTYGAPIVTDESDIPNGVLVIHQGLDSDINGDTLTREGIGLNDIVNNPEGLGKKGEVFIVNSEGFRMTDSRFKDDVFLKVKGEEIVVANCHVKGSILEAYENFKGDLTVGNAEPIDGTDWCLVAELNVEELFAPANRLKNLIILISLGIIILAIILGFFISRSITKPIQNLRQSAKDISRGKMDTKIEVRGKDEITDLARSFDDMRLSLKMIIEEYENQRKLLSDSEKLLDRKVKNRTKKVEDYYSKLNKKSESTANRLKELIPALNQVATGDLSVKIPLPKKWDEFSELIVGLNLMIEDLRLVRKNATLAKFPQTNPNIVMKIDDNGKLIYANPAARLLAKKFKVAVKKLIPKNSIDNCKNLIGTNKSMRERIKIKGKKFVFLFTCFKDEKAAFITGIEIKG